MFLPLSLAARPSRNARKVLCLAFDAVQDNPNVRVVLCLLLKEQIQNCLEVADRSHQGIDFMRDHSRHLIDDVSAL